MLLSLRTLLFFFLVLPFVHGANAQSPYLQLFDGQSSDRITALLTTDDAVYLSGNYSPSATLDGTDLPAYGEDDIFLRKTDPAGNALWTLTGGGNFDDRSEALSIDPEGNLYWTGSYRGTATLGDTTLNDPTNQKASFVARIGPEGTLLWVVTFRGTGFKNIDDLVYTDGRVAVVGSFSEELLLPNGDLLPSSSDDRSAFMSILDATTGALLLTDQVGTTGTFAARAVAVAPNGTLHLAGDFRGSGQVQSQTIQTQTQNDDVFYLRASPTSGFESIRRIGGANQALATDIATDADGNSYLSGNFFGLISTGTGLSTSSNNFQTDGFLLRIDAGGEPLWLRDFGGDGADNINAIYVAGDRVVVTGNFSESFSTSINYELQTAQTAGYLAKFRADTGVNTSGFTTTGDGLVNVFALAPGFGGPIFGGQFTGTLQLSALSAGAGSGFSGFWGQTGSSTVPTRDFLPARAVHIFPNPAAEFLQIDLKESKLHSWTLYDLAGYPLHYGTETRVPRSHLPSGTYLLELRTDRGRVTRLVHFQ